MAKFDKKLASILVKNGLKTEEEVSELLDRASGENKSLNEYIIENEIISEDLVTSCIALEMNIPPVDLNKYKVPPDVLEILPEDLANYYHVLPLAKIGSKLTIAVANPFDVLNLDDIKVVTDCDINPVVCSEPALKEGIQKAYHEDEHNLEDLMEDLDEPEDMELAEDKDDDDVDLAKLTEESSGAPVVKLVNMIIYEAIKIGVSDIHIEPFEKDVRVRYRLDGACQEHLKPPKRMQNAIVSRIKIMSDLDIAEKRRPQDGKFKLKVDGRDIDFRVSTLPVVHGEKVVMRILDSSNLALDLGSLGFEEKALNDFRNAINSPYGMILVTGPTGSGKSTTLYSAIKEVITPEDNIVTVEDPVEYQLADINQVPVNVKRGLTFAAALRSILRQDPDTVMIGEIRDQETVEIAIKAALTGHLVLSTLHTNDAPSTISRLVDMGVDPFMVASSTILVSAQRLSRRLCETCKKKVDIPAERLRAAQFTDEEIETAQLFGPVGCERCEKKGYKGRFALLETLPVNDNIKRMIIEGRSAVDIKVEAMKEGMITLRRCAILNALRGNTSLQMVLDVTMADK